MGKYYILLILSFFSLSILAHNVTNVRGMQEGRNIVLLYDLQADTRILQVYVEIDGKSRLVPNACLSGDVNRIVAKGQNRRIVYDVLSDYTNGLKADRIAFVINSDNTEVHDYVEVVHEYVDLGLSVKWATCNVGASKPEEYGDYFAWGETSTKSEFSDETYRWVEKDDWYWKYTKYCTNRDDGKWDGKDVLTTSDDAATVKWGSKWRMPTKEDLEELDKKCTFTLSSPNGVLGCKVTGPNGNSIFLPFAGYIDGITPKKRGEEGYYWSKSLNNNYNNFAGALWAYIYEGRVFGSASNSEFRNYGITIRPVTIH